MRVLAVIITVLCINSSCVTCDFCTETLNLCSWGSGEHRVFMAVFTSSLHASMLFITSSDSYNSRLVCTGRGCPRNTAHLLTVFVCVWETQTAIIKSCWKLSWLIEALRRPGPSCLLHLFYSLFSILIHSFHSSTSHFPADTLLFFTSATNSLFTSPLFLFKALFFLCHFFSSPNHFSTPHLYSSVFRSWHISEYIKVML